jgi:hypothetical protein
MPNWALPSRTRRRKREHGEAEVEAELEPRGIWRGRSSSGARLRRATAVSYGCAASARAGRRRGEVARMGSSCSARPIWRRGTAVGATVCHWAGSVDDVRQCGGEPLPLVGRERAGESGGRRAGGSRPASADGPKVERTTQ